MGKINGIMDISRQLQSIEPKVSTSPWTGYEYIRGYAVFVLPFSSGHLLGLRVWPQNDFGPYASIWHCTPEGAWSIYTDGPSLKTTCSRYWGPALRHAELTNIDLVWTGPNKLRVEMQKPEMAWKMSMVAPPTLQKINKLNTTLPLWTWKPAPLLRIREWMAKRFLDMGNVRFSFLSASGHKTIIMLEQTLIIKSSKAKWKGESLGEMIRLDYNPTIGEVSLPKQPTFVIGQAHMRIKDSEEYL